MNAYPLRDIHYEHDVEFVGQYAMLLEFKLLLQSELDVDVLRIKPQEDVHIYGQM